MRIASGKTRTALVLLLFLLLVLTLSLAGLRGWSAYQYRSARQALERRDFRQAEQALDRCFQVWSSDPNAHLLAAQAARRQNDYQGARKHLRRCRGKNDLKDAVAREYQLLGVQQGDLSDAEALFDSCSQHPNDAETPLILEALIKGFLQILTTATGLGITIQDDETIAKRESIQRAGETWLHLGSSTPGSILIQVGCRRAVDLWLTSRTSPADQVRGLVWRGQLYILLRDKSKAHADFRKALELDPTDFDARMFLAQSIAQKSPQEAVVHLQTLWEQHPHNNLVRFALAFTRRALGQLDEACQLLDAMLADNPNDVSALISRGYVALDMLQYDEAEQLLRRAVRLAPEETQSYAALQTCLRLQGKTTEAKQCQDKFEKLETERMRRREEIIQQMKAESKPVGAAAASRE